MRTAEAVRWCGGCGGARYLHQEVTYRGASTQLRKTCRPTQFSELELQKPLYSTYGTAAGANSAAEQQTTRKDLVSLVVEEESWKCEKNSDLRFPVSVPHPVILEIGCGSGAIALSLLCKLPQSQVIAVDKEKTAVDLTRENAHRLQLQDRIHILHHDVSHSSAKQLLLWGPLDFIVSNPPYVFHEDMASLDAEILCYENLDALDGGDDGMRVIKTILALAPSLLKDSGSVFLEVDHRHPDMVENWLRAHPNLLLVLRAIHKDFCGKPRFLHIQKQSR
ncbi:MTRF1L release factor glutamine methyltransferase isoform X8 [Columba livia]|uniref:MTRF1L release factor glutamine methyltransferase isoform X8 n=1 Tax=Columba livia TaxID=8932 RepID=UPI0031BB469F